MKRSGITWQVSSEKGMIRKTNQDAFFAASRVYEEEEYAVFCVADGMGGLENGEIASHFVVSEIEHWFDESFLDIITDELDCQSMRIQLCTLLKDINTKIIQNYTDKGISTGTTASILVLTPVHYFFAHCGDCRIYAVEKKEIWQMTEDHTAVNLLKKLGHASEATVFYKENVLASCIGISEAPEIQTSAGTLYQKQGFVLVSDGVYRFISEEDFLDKNGYIAHAAELTRKALYNQGNDNATAITVMLSSKQKGLYGKCKSYFKW